MRAVLIFVILCCTTLRKDRNQGSHFAISTNFSVKAQSVRLDSDNALYGTTVKDDEQKAHTPIYANVMLTEIKNWGSYQKFNRSSACDETSTEKFIDNCDVISIVVLTNIGSSFWIVFNVNSTAQKYAFVDHK
uniref:Uncharacterized protein n=1 Tax=Glossina palpalis gambiensis TaxID=67801 RepID=A0A1B0C7L2_9MUSC